MNAPQKQTVAMPQVQAHNWIGGDPRLLPPGIIGRAAPQAPAPGNSTTIIVPAKFDMGQN